MIETPLKYSSIFAFENEPNKFLASKKKSIAENFKFTVERSMEKAYSLALWLHIFKKDEEAIIVCDFLMQKDFDGDVCIWYHVEKAIGLKYVIEKQLFDYPEIHYDYRKKISDAQKANAEMRSKDKSDIKKYEQLYEGFLNGQIIEMELWSEQIIGRNDKKATLTDMSICS